MWEPFFKVIETTLELACANCNVTLPGVAPFRTQTLIRPSPVAELANLAAPNVNVAPDVVVRAVALSAVAPTIDATALRVAPEGTVIANMAP